MIEPVLFATTGAALYGSAHHLYQGMVRGNGRPHTIHALMFLFLAGFALTGASTGVVRSLAEFALFSKITVSLGILLFATLPWLVLQRLNRRDRLIPSLFTLAWSALLLVNLTSPYSLLFDDVAMTRNALSSGLTPATFQTLPNPAWHLVEVSMLGTLFYALHLCIKSYREAGGTLPVALLAGVLMLVFTTLYDILVQAGLTHTAYLAPMGFLFFLASAALQRQPTPAAPGHHGPDEANRYQITLNFNQPPDPEQPASPGDIPAASGTDIVQLAHQQSEPVPAFFDAGHPDAREQVERHVATPECAPADVVQETPGPGNAQDSKETETPATASAPRFDNPTVDRISDGLVDIAVDATLLLKRLERGDINPDELKELGRKVRSRAIETRRITHRMVKNKPDGQTR